MPLVPYPVKTPRIGDCPFLFCVNVHVATGVLSYSSLYDRVGHFNQKTTKGMCTVQHWGTKSPLALSPP